MRATLRNVGNNWILGTINGYDVQAKAFAVGSDHGIRGDDRISLLHVRPSGLDKMVVYHFDRNELVADGLPADVLATIVAAVGRVIKP